MPIQRLLSGRNFAPESVRVLCEASDRAMEKLHISKDDEAAKGSLARLILDLAAPRSKLTIEDLVDEVEAACGKGRDRRHGSADQ